MQRQAIFPWMRILVAGVFLAGPALVLPQTPAPEMQHANELMQAQRWPDAAQALEGIVKTDPTNGRAWFQLGMARYSLNEFPAAAVAFLKNIGLKNNPQSMFNLACVYGRMNEKEKALEWLTKSLAPEHKAAAFFDLNDADLVSLRDDPRFKELVLVAEKQKNPCMHSPESRQFDFFLGEWDAFNPQGRKDGSSVIQRFAGGCGIMENWTNALGGDGKSINFYDPKAGKWFQYWIGGDGTPARFSGVYRDGALRYEGEPAMQNGKRVISRLTFFKVDANTVRQLAEQSDDEGRSWTTTYDFKYVRRAPAK